jgi:hypothetical protein
MIERFCSLDRVDQCQHRSGANIQSGDNGRDWALKWMRVEFHNFSCADLIKKP